MWMGRDFWYREYLLSSFCWIVFEQDCCHLLSVRKAKKGILKSWNKLAIIWKLLHFFISIFKVKHVNTQIQLCFKKTINKNYLLSSEAKSAVWLMGNDISLCVCVVVKQTQSVMQMRYLESFYCCCNSQQGFKNIINNESTQMFCLLLSVVLLCNSKLVVSGYWSFSSFHFLFCFGLFWFLTYMSNRSFDISEYWTCHVIQVKDFWSPWLF